MRRPARREPRDPVAEMKRGQWQFVCHGAEIQDALTSFAVTPATNAKRVQMFVGPAHDDLDDIVQLPERQVLGNEDASPNRWAQAAQSNSKLKDGGRRPGIGSHARIVGASLASRRWSGRSPPFWRALQEEVSPSSQLRTG